MEPEKEGEKRQEKAAIWKQREKNLLFLCLKISYWKEGHYNPVRTLFPASAKLDRTQGPQPALGNPG